MDFSIHKRRSSNKKNYEDESIDLAYEFTKQIHKELKDLVKSVVLFGSAAKNKEKPHDIDILLIVDDVSIQFNEELIRTYRVIVEKTVQKVSNKIHVTSMKFTSFWEYIRAGDPISLNILRDGHPILDTGFFEPIQILLHQGRLKPSPEALWAYYNRAPNNLKMSRVKILEACVDLYWSVIDASHSALMSIEEIPPSPAHVPEFFEQKLVKKGLADKKMVWTIKKFYDLYKRITSKEIRFVSGKEYDAYYKEAKEFLEKIIKK